MQESSKGGGLGAVADLVLARSARAGDPAAAERLAERLGCVRNFLLTVHARMGRPLSAQDLAEVEQNIQGALWTKLDRYDGQHPLEAWAWGFCGLELVKFLERRRRRERLEYGVDADRCGSAAHARETTHLDGDRIHDALLCLAAPASEVVRLKTFDDLSFEQIGKRLGMPTNTAKTHYYRALVRLRRSLARHGYGEDRASKTGEA